MRKIIVSSAPALCLLGASLITTAAQASSQEGVKQVEVAVSDSQCDPMQLSVPAGKVQFTIRNKSMRALEFEILDGVMVVEERENIAPGFMQKMTANLEPGEYDITCGLLTNPRGKLVVSAGANSEPYEVSATDLVGPLAEYKFYVSLQTRSLLENTQAFTDAIRAQDLDKAKALYEQAREPYERIEPVAELFSDLDASIDAREDDFAKGVEDPAFSGFHRIEYLLWEQQDTAAAAPFADQLDADVADLAERIRALPFPPEKVVGGAAALVEEIAASKLSGEEDRYARTDLADFQANIDGANKILSLFRPLLTKADAPLTKRVDSNMQRVETTLAAYRKEDGSFAPYNDLSDSDRTALKGPITALAEDLSQLRGSLGLN